MILCCNEKRYRKKQTEDREQVAPSIVCESCALKLSEKAVRYCLGRKHQFKGRILCYKCSMLFDSLPKTWRQKILATFEHARTELPLLKSEPERLFLILQKDDK